MNCKVILLLTTLLVIASEAKRGGTLNVLVLPCSYASYSFPVFADINENWNKYGSTPVFINYTSAYLRGFTEYDLVDYDVLILSDNVGAGCYLSSDEVAALSNFAADGHSIIGTYIIFESAEYGLESIFGFNIIGDAYTTGTQNQVWTQATQDPLFNNIPSSWTGTSWPGVMTPTAGWESIVNEAEILATNADETGVITIYNKAGYIAIYISYIPEYAGGMSDTQLLYNAMVYDTAGECSSATTCASCTGLGCFWCLEASTCDDNIDTCNSYIKNPQYCPKQDCTTFTTCDDCLSNDNNEYCDWCLDTQGCIEISDSAQCEDAVNDAQYCLLKKKKNL